MSALSTAPTTRFLCPPCNGTSRCSAAFHMLSQPSVASSRWQTCDSSRRWVSGVLPFQNRDIDRRVGSNGNGSAPSEGHVPGGLAVKHGSLDSKTLLECAALATRATAASRARLTGPPSQTTSWRSESPHEASDKDPRRSRRLPPRNRPWPIPPESATLSSSRLRQADGALSSPRILHRRVASDERRAASPSYEMPL